MNGLGQPGDGVAAFDFERELFVERVRGAELHFNLFSGALTDEEIVGALHVVDHGGIELVACDAHGLRKDHAGEGNDGDLGGAAADVDDHVGGRFFDREADSDGGGHGLGDGDHIACAGMERGVFHGAFFDLGDAGGDGDDDAGVYAEGAVADLADEVAEHRLGDVEVGDDAVLHRADGGDVAWGAPEHAFGFVADSADLAGVGVDGDHGRFAHDDAFILRVNEGVGRA